MLEQNPEKRFVDWLRAGASALVISASLMAVPSALAQGTEATETDPDEDEEQVLDAIRVEGIRGSLQSAQDIKRNADQVVDSITAVDIGALPDRSVSEALQRVPGVQLQRTNENRDPARLASEGGAVFIRGLSFVRTELNGRDIYSASGGRSLSFEDVSADLLAGVDVYKNPSAELVEGGIGGIVNLRTRKPFDNDGRLIAGSLDYNYADLLEEGFTSGNLLYSDNWDTDIGRVGILLSGSIGNIGNRTDSIQTGRHDPFVLGSAQGGFSAGDTVYLPFSIGFRSIEWEQERTAFAGSIQWAPNPDMTFTLEGLTAEASPVDIERAVNIGAPFDGGLNPTVGAFEYFPDGTLRSGTFNNASLTYNSRYGNRESKTSDISLNFKYIPAGKWAFGADIQYVESSTDILSMTAFTQLGTQNGFNDWPTVTFDLAGDDPSISVGSPELQAMQNQYWWAAAMDHIQDNDAHSWAQRADLDYQFDDGKLLKSFRVGVRATQKTAITRQSGYNWNLLNNQFWGNGGGAVRYIDQDAADQTEFYDYPGFFRGDINAPAVGWFPVEGLLTDTQRAYDYLQATQTSGWGWVPLTPDAYTSLNPQGDNVSAGINEQQEDTLAFYGVLSFGDEEGQYLGKPFDGNIGLRIVETETTAIGRSAAGGLSDQCAGSPSADCDAAAAFIAAFNAELGDYKEFTNAYTTLLPSFNIRFHLNDELQLRLAASRAMVRPSFSQTRPYANLTFNFEGNQFNPNVLTPFTGVAGAPGLKPTLATQYDASLEWYFSPVGSLTVAVFRKEIEDYVALASQFETFTYGGETFDFQVIRQINAESGTLQGFEIAYQQFYDFLPAPFDGLGMQANFTYIDNSGGVNTAINPFEDAQQAGAFNETLPIEGISETSYNIAAMYEKYGISARLAYNWRERYLLTTSAANLNAPVWSDDYGQLDGSIFYSINDNLKVGVQGTNLLNSRTYLEVGNPSLTPRYSWTDTDRRIAGVIRFSF